jgi:hypothetical protein
MYFHCRCTFSDLKLPKKLNCLLGAVVHICNPSYLGGISIVVWGQPSQKVRLYLKNSLKKKRKTNKKKSGGCGSNGRALPSKHKALRSKTSTTNFFLKRKEIEFSFGLLFLGPWSQLQNPHFMHFTHNLHLTSSLKCTDPYKSNHPSVSAHYDMISTKPQSEFSPAVCLCTGSPR